MVSTLSLRLTALSSDLPPSLTLSFHHSALCYPLFSSGIQPAVRQPSYPAPGAKQWTSPFVHAPSHWPVPVTLVLKSICYDHRVIRGPAQPSHPNPLSHPPVHPPLISLFETPLYPLQLQPCLAEHPVGKPAAGQSCLIHKPVPCALCTTAGCHVWLKMQVNPYANLVHIVVTISVTSSASSTIVDEMWCEVQQSAQKTAWPAMHCMSLTCIL